MKHIRPRRGIIKDLIFSRFRFLKKSLRIRLLKKPYIKRHSYNNALELIYLKPSSLRETIADRAQVFGRFVRSFILSLKAMHPKNPIN